MFYTSPLNNPTWRHNALLSLNINNEPTIANDCATRGA